ncbi:hypothetical protein HN615_12700 [Candidatus Woesearchaeota archaeon]|jgi:hypothetical protein|nr:hypothetical protein [Candidatus Woesearchaeota archaeon]|tara:strand:+ start:1162 stop:1590 length:429 start_codon:yes stop_codon:yes gene_type:complete
MKKTRIIRNFLFWFVLGFVMMGTVSSQTRPKAKVEITDKTFKSAVSKGFVVVIFTADYQLKNIDPKMIKDIEGHEKTVVVSIQHNSVSAVVKKLRLRNYPSIALFHNGAKKKVWKPDMDGNLGITQKDIKKEITNTLAGDVF